MSGERAVFAEALAAMRGGAPNSLCGRTLTVNGIALAITDDEFDIAWDAMDEITALEEADFSLPGGGTDG